MDANKLLKEFSIFPANAIAEIIDSIPPEEMKDVIIQSGGYDMLNESLNEQLKELEAKISQLEFHLDNTNNNKEVTLKLIETLKKHK